MYKIVEDPAAIIHVTAFQKMSKLHDRYRQRHGKKDLESFFPFVVKDAPPINNAYEFVRNGILLLCVARRVATQTCCLNVDYICMSVEDPAAIIPIIPKLEPLVAWLRCLSVLSRGLNDQAQEVKRTCCSIFDHTCNIVEDPAAVLPTMSKYELFAKARGENMSNLAARNMAERALELWHPWQRV